MRLLFYKNLTIVVFLCSGFALIYEKFVIGAIIFFIGIAVSYGYRCPYCGERFDLRLKKSKLQHCPKCGKGMKW